MTYDGLTAGSGIITGDAVVIELRYAKLPSRSLAFALDLLIQISALVIMTLLVGALTSFADDVMVYVLMFVITLGIFIGYPVTCETLTRGRTVGKLAVGLRVVRDDGGAIRFRHALVRGLLAVVEVYIFLAISVITSLLSPEGKRLGDYLAGTVVVRERAPRSPVQKSYAPWIHPALQPWAATLDLSRLQPATAMGVRQFLSRAHSLTPDARQRLGASLYAEVAQQVSPPPPMPVPAETYLAAVLAERARRAEGAAEVAARPAAASIARDVEPDVEVDSTEQSGQGFAAPS
ncbi:MAG: RDD family protein [Actinomycetes bacterium]